MITPGGGGGSLISELGVRLASAHRTVILLPASPPSEGTDGVGSFI